MQLLYASPKVGNYVTAKSYYEISLTEWRKVSMNMDNKNMYACRFNQYKICHQIQLNNDVASNYKSLFPVMWPHGT